MTIGDLCKSDGAGILPVVSGLVLQGNWTGWKPVPLLACTFAEVSIDNFEMKPEGLQVGRQMEKETFSGRNAFYRLTYRAG